MENKIDRIDNQVQDDVRELLNNYVVEPVKNCILVKIEEQGSIINNIEAENKKIKRTCEDVTDTINQTLGKTKTYLEDSIGNAENNIKKEIEKAQNTLEKDINSTKDDIKNSIERISSILSETPAAVQIAVKADIETVRESVGKNCTEIENQIISGQQSADIKYQDIIAKIEESGGAAESNYSKLFFLLRASLILGAVNFAGVVIAIILQCVT